MRYLTFTTLIVLLSTLTFAGPNGKFIYHTVEKGQTLYSISRQYGLKPEDIVPYNESIGTKLTIQVGQKLRIPAPEMSAAVDNTPQVSAQGQYHVVGKGETIYGISRMYNVSKNDLMSWNKIKDNNITVGQKLVIKNQNDAAAAPIEKPHAAPVQSPSTEPAISKDQVEKAMDNAGYTWTVSAAENDKHKTSVSDASGYVNVSTASGDITASASAVGMADNKSIKTWKAESTGSIRDYYRSKPDVYDASAEYETLYYQNIYSGMAKRTEKGVAKLLNDNTTANTAYYNNAPIGTILKLVNSENGKTTFAIVVGKIPTEESNSYLLKLSSKVARNLAVKDYNSVEVVSYVEN